MSSPNEEFKPERYRGYLLVIARQRWNAALRARCQPADIVHDAIVAAIECLHQFRGETGEEFRGWLCKILLNTIRDRVKKLHRHKWDYRRECSLEAAAAQSSDALYQFAQNAPSPRDLADTEEKLLRMADALAELSDKQLAAISLHHLDGLTLVETAKELGWTESSVAGHLRRGLARLRELMEVRRES